ncbi:MAG: hypothetical protein HYU27_07975, partial [Acidobacteria bacterium]|nr:hypothetical protein [Acidobacteriota bacterium]
MRRKEISDFGFRISDLGNARECKAFRKNPKSEIRNPKSLLLLLPFLLLSCGAVWQADSKSPVELARTGQYKEAAAALEPMVAGGNFEPLVVESLYFSWIR